MARKRPLRELREKRIFPYHARSCPAKGWDLADVCVGPPVCNPTYQAEVSHKGKRAKSDHVPTIAAAKSWLTDADHDAKRGTFRPPTSLGVADELRSLIADMKSGKQLDRKRKRYKPSTIRSYETS